METTGVDHPCLPDCPLGESPTISHCHLNVGTFDCENQTFYYQLLKLSQVKVETLESYCLRLK